MNDRKQRIDSLIHQAKEGTIIPRQALRRMGWLRTMALMHKWKHRRLYQDAYNVLAGQIYGRIL